MQGGGSARAHILIGVFNSGRGGGMFGLLMLRISDKFAEETRSNNAAGTSHLYRHRQRNTLRNGQTDISHKETYSTHMYSVYTVYIQ